MAGNNTNRVTGFGQGVNAFENLASLLPQRNGTQTQASADPRPLISDSITKDERSELLGGRKKGLPDLKQMKKIAASLLEKKGEIKKDIKTIDPTSTTDLSQTFDNVVQTLKSKTNVKSMSKPVLAVEIASFLGLAELLFDHKMAARLESVGGRTRNGVLQQSNGENLPAIDKFYRECVAILQEVDKAVAENKSSKDGDSSNLLKGLTVPPQLMCLQFDPDRCPSDSKLQRCAFCGHRSTNTLEEDDNLVEANRNKMQQNKHEIRVWDQYETRCNEAAAAGQPKPALPVNPNTNKEMKRRPQAVGKAQLRQSRIICLCSTSTCLQEGSDSGSSCPIGCRKNCRGGDATTTTATAESERYEWVNTGNGQLRRCSCPVCQCTCNKMYYADDSNRIMVAKAQMERIQVNQVSAAQQVSQFMGTMMTAGYQAVADTTHAVQKNGWTAPRNARHFQQDVFFGAGAECAARLGREQLGSNAIEMLQEQFGSSTDVILPSGHQFNTNYTTRNSNAHVRNNRIPTANTNDASSEQHPSGMIDRLKPDYTELDDNYKEAAMNPNNLASSIAVLKDTIGRNNNNSSAVSAVSRAPAASRSVATAAAASLPSTAASRGDTDSFTSEKVDEMTEQEQIRFAMIASMESEYAQRDDHGGKMPPNAASSDLFSPPARSIFQGATHPSTMSTLGASIPSVSTTIATTEQGGSTLLSSFNDVGSNVNSNEMRKKLRKEKDAARIENSHELLRIVKVKNNKLCHNHKRKEDMTTPEKKDRKKAKQRQKLIKEVEKGGDADVERVMSNMVNHNDPDELTLSQGVPDFDTPVLLNRFENSAAQSSSEEEED